jgi:hypothetical protein
VTIRNRCRSSRLAVERLEGRFALSGDAFRLADVFHTHQYDYHSAHGMNPAGIEVTRLLDTHFIEKGFRFLPRSSGLTSSASAAWIAPRLGHVQTSAGTGTGILPGGPTPTRGDRATETHAAVALAHDPAVGFLSAHPSGAPGPLYSKSDIVADDSGATSSPVTAFQSDSFIEASDDLWWFGGETPQNYATQITIWDDMLTPDGTFTWTITSGAGIVQFANGSSTYTAVNDNRATLVSIGASAAAESLTLDVTIHLTYNGFDFGTAHMAVATPDHLVHLKDEDFIDLIGKYSSLIHYQIVDQFNRQLPKNVEVNEQWTTGAVSDFAGENWPRGNPNGAMVNPADFSDQISGVAQQGVTFTPAPQEPQNPLGNVKVDHWGQAFYVGSKTPGKGVKVQTDTLQRYQDHGRHLDVKSPP